MQRNADGCAALTEKREGIASWTETAVRHGDTENVPCVLPFSTKSGRVPSSEGLHQNRDTPLHRFRKLEDTDIFNSLEDLQRQKSTCGISSLTILGDSQGICARLNVVTTMWEFFFAAYTLHSGSSLRE